MTQIYAQSHLCSRLSMLLQPFFISEMCEISSSSDAISLSKSAFCSSSSSASRFLSCTKQLVRHKTQQNILHAKLLNQFSQTLAAASEKGLSSKQNRVFLTLAAWRDFFSLSNRCKTVSLFLVHHQTARMVCTMCDTLCQQKLHFRLHFFELQRSKQELTRSSDL